MKNKGGGLGLLSVLGIVFVVLKLIGVIDWSWIWVLCPFWIEIALFIILYMVIKITMKIVIWWMSR